MKKTMRFLFLAGLIGSSEVNANQVCQKNFGVMECGFGIVESISFTGLIEMNGTTVSDSFNVLGTVNAQNSLINRMQVRGVNSLKMSKVTGYMNVTGDVNATDLTVSAPMSLTGNFFGNHVVLDSTVKIVGASRCDICEFRDSVTLIGDIEVDNSKFMKPITLNTINGKFSNTSLDDITVKNTSGKPEQTIQLKKNSVAQNINFESANGVVILSGNSKITGSVQGGKIITR